MEAAAASAGVSSRTLRRWRAEPPFATLLRDAQDEAFEFARSGKSIFLVDYFSFGNPARRLITLRFCRLLREQLITVWIDSAPRAELGDQQVTAFHEGRFIGLGDLTWFEQSHPDWDYDVAPTPAKKGNGGVNEGTIEAIETEELVNEA